MTCPITESCIGLHNLRTCHLERGPTPIVISPVLPSPTLSKHQSTVSTALTVACSVSAVMPRVASFLAVVTQHQTARNHPCGARARTLVCFLVELYSIAATFHILCVPPSAHRSPCYPLTLLTHLSSTFLSWNRSPCPKPLSLKYPKPTINCPKALQGLIPPAPLLPQVPGNKQAAPKPAQEMGCSEHRRPPSHTASGWR